VIVVSHRFWRTSLGADPAVVGGPITVNGRPFTLVGVAPEGFTGLMTGLPTDAWVPIAMQPHLKPRTNMTDGAWLWLFGRLRDGVTAAVARQELAALTAAGIEEAGEAAGPDAFTSIHVSPLTGVPHRERRLVLAFMSLLLGAAGVVLLISAVNVAALLSARALARRREMAVRVALGAGRARLVRQLLTEVLVLFLLGAMGGLALAAVATAAVEQMPLPASVPIALELSPDYRVLVFALVTSLVTGLAFGLVPALRAARAEVTTPLREASPGGGLRGTRVGRALVVAQLAGSLVLLVAAGLFLRALDRGSRIDPGFDANGVVVAAFDAESWGYDEARARAFYAALRERYTVRVEDEASAGDARASAR
jgi:predicted permease